MVQTSNTDLQTRLKTRLREINARNRREDAELMRQVNLIKKHFLKLKAKTTKF